MAARVEALAKAAVAAARTPYIDSWYHRTLEEPELNLPVLAGGEEEADVCVVGGGLAGISTALGLVERGKSVVLVESKRVGYAASGRNGGFGLTGFQMEGAELIEALGEPKAKAFFDMSLDAYRLVRSRIDKHKIKCGVKDVGTLTLSCFPKSASEYEEAVETSNKALGTKLQYWPAEKVRAMYKSPLYHHGLFDPMAFTVNPLGMTIGMARAAHEAGARIYEGTEAVHVKKNSNGLENTTRKFSVWTSSSAGNAIVYADNVVLANNYMADQSNLDTVLAKSSVPLYTYIVVTKPLGNLLQDVLGDNQHCVCDDRFALGYFRPVEDGRLLWGGLATAYPLSEEEQEKKITEDMAHVFPQLKGVGVECVWGGRINVARDFMPLIGKTDQGVWYCTAFAGHGLVATTLGGDVVASAIASGDERWKLFQESFPIRYVGWPFHQAAVYFFTKVEGLIDRIKWLTS